MSFEYKKRSRDELEQIAGIILSRYANRCNGCVVDIEGVIEDGGITILLRRGGLNKFCEGYVAEDPHYIVLSEIYASYQPRYRPILSEELCHIVLEYGLLNAGTALPLDGKPHALTPQQHRDIEDDANYLCLAILLPKESFIEKFNDCYQNAPTTARNGPDSHLKYCAEKLEKVFVVWSYKIAARARDLGLISELDFKNYFTDRIPM